ncbi:cysteine-rich CWC family protein [Undibacterium sp. SXout7W]|uniref:cysteine-rich CWC family protein n=1 Tax=Undibacterium sp. SXout7W TaxID=3413049 RepID=UPI003BF3C4DE
MSICPRCKTLFTCAMADCTNQPCWCAALPPVDSALLSTDQSASEAGSQENQQASCFCPTCLPLWKAEQSAKKTPSS